MADSYTYEGTLNVTGDIRVNGRQVYTEAPKKYDMNGKIVTHRAIPVHTVRPGYRYCFPDGYVYIRGVEDADLQDESFESLWENMWPMGNNIKMSYRQREVGLGHSIVVYIPKNFDAHAFLTDSAYVESLCFRTPDGVLETTSPNFEIHSGKNVCVAKIDYVKRDQIQFKGKYILRNRKQHIQLKPDGYTYTSKYGQKTRTNAELFCSGDEYLTIDSVIPNKHLYSPTSVIYPVYRYNRRFIKSIYAKKLYTRYNNRTKKFEYRFEPNNIKAL